MLKYVVEDTLKVEYVEDGGAALIGELFLLPTESCNDERGVFVRLHSWDEDFDHTDFNSFKGKRIRITVEILEDGEV